MLLLIMILTSRHIGLGFLPGVSLDEPVGTGWVDNTYAKGGGIRRPNFFWY